MIENFRIEYFEKPLEDYYKKLVYDFNHQSNVLLSMIGYGTMIIDKNGNIKLLKEKIKEVYSNPLPKLDEDTIIEQLSILSNRIHNLQVLADNNDPYFNHLYHLP